MSKTFTFVVFFSIGSVLIGLIHYYLWIRLVKDSGLNGNSKIIIKYTLIGLATSFPIAVILSRIISYKYSFYFLWFSYFWLGMMILFFFLLVFIDFIKLIVYFYTKFIGSSKSVIDIERRQFISDLISASATGLVLIASGIGVNNYYSRAVVKKVKINFNGLPKVFNGFRIVQISDLHIGQLMTGARLKEIVKQVNDLSPDLIAITGDLADGSVDKLLKDTIPLVNLKSEKGVYFVTGNHEYYSGVEKWILEIEKMGIKVLNNQNLKIEKGNDYFYLAGVNDHDAKRFGKKYAADFKKALLGLEKDKNIILLAHQPIAVKEASEYGTDLVLSGHTHGGQIWPFNYFVYLQQPYLKGSYEYNGTQLYVNQGTGCWGPPLRLGSYNEITEIIFSVNS